jgi:hypothetical protein
VAVKMNRNSELRIPVPDYTDENVMVKVVKMPERFIRDNYEFAAGLLCILKKYNNAMVLVLLSVQDTMSGRFGDTDPDPNGRFSHVPGDHKVTLGEIVDLLETFKRQPETLEMPTIPNGSFTKKIYNLYLIYLPKDKFSSYLKMNCDDRGSFKELLRTCKNGG